MFPIQIDVRQFGIGANRLSHDVFIMASKLGNMKEPLNKSIDDVIIQSIALNFAFGGRPRWKKLSYERLMARRSMDPILIDTTKLVQAATSKMIWRVTNTEASMDFLDSRVPYAKYHQEGTKNMPQRQFAVLQTRDIDDIVNIFSDWLDGIAVAHWRSSL